MVNNRITIKIPRDSFATLKMKKQNIEQRYKQITGKPKQIPMVSLIRYISQRPIYIEDSEIKNLFNRKRRGKLI